jgi:hypothetical protein
MAVVGGVADLITCAAIGAFGLGHVRPVVLVLVCWAQTDVVLLAALVGLVVLANLDRIVVIYRPRGVARTVVMAEMAVGVLVIVLGIFSAVTSVVLHADLVLSFRLDGPIGLNVFHRWSLFLRPDRFLFHPPRLHPHLFVPRIAVLCLIRLIHLLKVIVMIVLKNLLTLQLSDNSVQLPEGGSQLPEGGSQLPESYCTPHRHKENHHRCHRQIRHFHQTYTHLTPHLNRPTHHNNATQFALGLASVVVVAVRA